MSWLHLQILVLLLSFYQLPGCFFLYLPLCPLLARLFSTHFHASKALGIGGMVVGFSRDMAFSAFNDVMSYEFPSLFSAEDRTAKSDPWHLGQGKKTLNYVAFFNVNMACICFVRLSRVATCTEWSGDSLTQSRLFLQVLLLQPVYISCI
jgi:hypothetical protein